MNLIRSVLHMLWMGVTVIPWATAVVILSPLVGSTRLYWICVGWLATAVKGGTWILGIRNRVSGMENLPLGAKDAAVLLVKHQSTWETFVMPTLMPHPLAYVFKRELLRVPSGNMMTHTPWPSRRRPWLTTLPKASLRLLRSMWIMSSRDMAQPKNGT